MKKLSEARLLALRIKEYSAAVQALGAAAFRGEVGAKGRHTLRQKQLIELINMLNKMLQQITIDTGDNT